MDAHRILTNTRRSASPARLVVALTVEALTRPVDAGSRRNAREALADGRAAHQEHATTWTVRRSGR